MNSKQKNKEKDRHPTSGTESKLASLARSFQRQVRFLKPSNSESKASAKQRHETKDSQGPVGASARFSAVSLLTRRNHPDHPSPSIPPSVDLSANTLAHQSSTTTLNPLPSQRRLSSTVTSDFQTIHAENYGSNNRLHVGDDNRGTIGIIGHNSINFLVQQFYHSSQTGERSMSTKFSFMIIAVVFIEATQQVLSTLFGTAIDTEFENNDSEGKIVEANFRRLIKSIASAMQRDDQSIRQALRDYLKDLWSDLCREREQLFNADNNSPDVEILSLDIAWKLRTFLFVNHMGGYIPPAIVVDGVKKRIVKLLRNAEAAAPQQSIKDLPCVRAAYDEYVSSRQRRVSCFDGTRQALLEEMGGWVAKADAKIFVLFGLAGIGKSTIAQTVAERADNVRLLGASFFFSRDEAERRTAERFFTTIASQLRVRHPEFASAIESTLMTEQGKDAITKFPLEQLETLILEPLQGLTPRNVVIVVDALDECDHEDVPSVLVGLNKLVQVLPSFKVVLTTRPQQHLQLLRGSQESQKVFDLHDIEDKVVDGDIERYLRHKLSFGEVKTCLPSLREPWAANDDEIKCLVRAAGRLFIIASTAVLFILDKTSTPASRMKLLLSALERDHTPFKALNRFYTTILRSAVPEISEDDTRDCYQKVIGTIILLQQPLTIYALAKLINVGVNEITIVLGNLQPVILLGSNDIPLTYHKSFPDYIINPDHCRDEDLRIDPKSHHTRIAMRCLRLLNQRLKQNLLGLSDPARFMENGEALAKEGLMKNHIQEKIPMEVQYACLHFANHLESADIESPALAEEMGHFFDERFLNWLEALSWIEKLDSAHRTLLTVQKQLKSTGSDLRQLVTDGLRFVGKFYELIKRSALHTYHSALPLTPTGTILYKKYSKEMTFCQVQGGQERWDEVISTFIGTFIDVRHVVFSSKGTLFASCIDVKDWRDSDGMTGLMTIHDAIAGIPLGTIKGRAFAIANNFSKAASFDDGLITLYYVKGITPVATIKPSVTVVNLVLSPDGSRLVAGLDDTTVCIWDTEKCEQIKSFSGWEKQSEIAFSSDGNRIAFASCDGVVKLLDGRSGKIIANLEFPGLQHWVIFKSRLRFSGDGSRLACCSMNSLKLWNSQDGALIGTAEDAGAIMAISTDGSRLVTVTKTFKTKLFSGTNLALPQTIDLRLKFPIRSLEIHNDLIGVASSHGHVALYNINSYECIASKLPFPEITCLTFSPDCTRLAAGNFKGDVRLWDVQSISASNNPSEGGRCIALAFSTDGSRLASGHDGGAIKLWDTVNMAEVAPSLRKRHPNCVYALAFSLDGEDFASGSDDGTIKLWSGKDGTLRDHILAHLEGRYCEAVALSSSMLAATGKDIITLWDLKSRSVVAKLGQHHCFPNLLTFSHRHSLLAAVHDGQMTLWDTGTHEVVTIFKLNKRKFRRMKFLPDDSQISVQGDEDDFYLFNTYDSEVSSEASERDICRLVPWTSFHGIPVWNRGDGNVVGLFPHQENAVTVFSCHGDVLDHKIAEELSTSMIALEFEGGGVLLIKAVN